jgi:predicted metal-dependent phosphoesterase TrpH
MVRKLKVDFHTHSADDPQDYINFSSTALIDRAHRLGFDALAITNHDIVTFSPELERYAAERGVLLIPGVELTLSHKHVLLINPDPAGCPALRTLEDLAKMEKQGRLVVAPHPFYPGFKCLKSDLVTHISSFDAVEFSFFYSRTINCNEKAVSVARAHNKPLVGSSDCHNIWQMGLTSTLVEAEKNIPAIITAVKEGKVEIRTTPLSLLAMLRVGINFLLGDRLKVRLRI